MLRRILSSSSTKLPVLLLVAAALVLTACPQKTPEERVLDARSKYTVQLNTFLAQEPEPEPILEGDADPAGYASGEVEAVAVAAEAAVAEEAEAAEGEGGEEGEAEMEEMAETGPTTTSIFFDLIVQFDGQESLPGVTVEITHADPFEKEKANFSHYVETGKMVKSETKQVSFTLEIDNFEEGDVFSLELRSFVPPEERGEYREFAEHGFE